MLFDGWDTIPTGTFEARLGALAEAGGRFLWTEPSRAALAGGLRGEGEVAVRAAVLLGHSRHVSSAELLVERLEERAVATARPLDAGDVVAAAALSRPGLRRGLTRRLEVLVVGEEPHPDLEVRVEIARTVLGHGRDTVAPFLLRVLRAGTPAELEHPPDWERTTNLFWAKTRGAEALSRHVGVPCAFRPDSAWEEQMAEADRLEGKLKAAAERR